MSERKRLTVRVQAGDETIDLEEWVNAYLDQFDKPQPPEDK